MKIVLQRVSEASVSVKKEEISAIGAGLLLLVGIHQDDTKEKMEWLCNKILKLRVFDDEDGKMNDSVLDVGGDILVVPQFTLYGDAQSGNRPSYIEAAGPEKARNLYKAVIEYLREHSPLSIQSGSFGAYMDVQLHNDGPVTIVLER